MQKEQLSYPLLLQKAKEEGMTFSNLMGGAVLEEIVYQIGLSAYQERLWLKNHGVLGKNQYERHLILQLEYDYVVSFEHKANREKEDRVLLEELAKGLQEEVFSAMGECSYQLVKKCLKLQISVKLEEMLVPVSIKIQLLQEDKKVPRKEIIPSTVFPKRRISYYSYPTEAALAEYYIEIMTKLELIPDLMPYYQVYRLLEQESVDGRKVKEYIEEQCRKQQIAKTKHRLDYVMGYREYTYMKKKWKVFLRSIHSKEPAWEQVMDRFVSFFTPIWKAIMEDEIFFGDWMPELNRFL